MTPTSPIAISIGQATQAISTEPITYPVTSIPSKLHQHGATIPSSGIILSLVEGERELILPKPLRQQKAHIVIENWFEYQASSQDFSESTVYATDGSIFPSTNKPNIHRTISSVCVTTSTIMIAIIKGNAVKVMQAELFGIVMACVQALRQGDRDVIILTDYLNATNRITRLRYGHDPTIDQKSHPISYGEAWYNWIAILVRELEITGTRLTMYYIKAHVTSGTIAEHVLNQKADDHTREARQPGTRPLYHAPWPTFFMEDFIPWTEETSYIEQDLYIWVKTRMMEKRERRVIASNPLMDIIIFEKDVANTKYYSKTARDYSLKI
jgi:hypothetical protein